MYRDPVVQAIKMRRERAGITQAALAERAGLSAKTYQRIEAGQADMRMSQYRALIRALRATDLDISLDMLGNREVTPWDVAAAARVLSADVRAVLIQLIMMIYQDRD